MVCQRSHPHPRQPEPAMSSSLVARVVLVTAALTLTACGEKKEQAIADTTSTPIAPPTVTPTPAGTVAASGSLALADIAGTWKLRSTPKNGSDMTPSTSTLTATG